MTHWRDYHWNFLLGQVTPIGISSVSTASNWLTIFKAVVTCFRLLSLSLSLSLTHTHIEFLTLCLVYFRDYQILLFLEVKFRNGLALDVRVITYKCLLVDVMSYWALCYVLFLYPMGRINIIEIGDFHVLFMSMNFKLHIAQNLIILWQNMVKLNHLTFGCFICPLTVPSPIGVKYVVA